MKTVKSNGKTYLYDILHITISQQDKAELKQVSEELGISMSDVVRMSLKRFIDALKNK